MDNAFEQLDISRLGLNLYRLREERKISHEALAEMVGVSTRVVYDWESGAKKPSLTNLVRLANCLAVSTDSLLS
jgi:transcriptional regulator with XRE-family HTH domain